MPTSFERIRIYFIITGKRVRPSTQVDGRWTNKKPEDIFFATNASYELFTTAYLVIDHFADTLFHCPMRRLLCETNSNLSAIIFEITPATISFNLFLLTCNMLVAHIDVTAERPHADQNALIAKSQFCIVELGT